MSFGDPEGTVAKVQKVLSAASPLEIFRATPMQRIELLKSGLRARDAKRILADLNIPDAGAYRAVKVSRATLNAGARRDGFMLGHSAERILGLAKLIGQVQQMAEDAGNPTDFSARSWLSVWLIQPLPALGGACPIDYLDTMEGQKLVANLLRQIQGGAYA